MTEATTPTTTPAPAPTGLAALRVPVEDRYIAKLPKPTKAQTEDCRRPPNGGEPRVKATFCQLCKSYHHPNVVHLDYVGHAATTARLLEVDPHWTWEPVAFDKDTGLPKFDHKGGLWIRLTILGVTRLGYGSADEKTNADAGSHEKECIGDAIRNAAMRFGWALELWHKGGDLFLPTPSDDDPESAGGKGAKAAKSGPPADDTGGSSTPPVDKTPGKPAYTDKQLKENLPTWTAAFTEKTTDAARVITKIQSRYTLTAKQRADIKAAEVKATQPPKA